MNAQRAAATAHRPTIGWREWVSLPGIGVPWINAAIHGDGVNGVEIIRRVLAEISSSSPNTTLLNRAFPGSERGPLASRLAHLFSREVVARCAVGIDLHTGSDHRTNLPQIRADLDDLVRSRRVVTKGQLLGLIHDEFGRRLAVVKANTDGIVIGLNLSPIVNQGEAVIHIAQPKEHLD